MTTPEECRHPGFAWGELVNALQCTACGETVGLLDLIDATRVTISMGCFCEDGEDGGRAPHRPMCFKPMGWSLDPEQLRAMIDAVPHFIRRRTLLGAFLYGERDPKEGIKNDDGNA